jgi:small subunit ribosomal protein S16
MSVSLRMQRYGQTKRPFYRMVATSTASRRDGRYLEIVGTYNPMVNPAVVTLKEDRIKYWIAAGAKKSELVRSLLRKQIPGLVEAREAAKNEKIKNKRLARKAKPATKNERSEGKAKRVASRKAARIKAAEKAKEAPAEEANA